MVDQLPCDFGGQRLPLHGFGSKISVLWAVNVITHAGEHSPNAMESRVWSHTRGKQTFDGEHSTGHMCGAGLEGACLGSEREQPHIAGILNYYRSQRHFCNSSYETKRVGVYMVITQQV